MNNFRKQNFRILIATDIAARGLDVPHIEHVINYDLPQVAEDYIHRMGRTARAGANGSALSFVSSQDERKWAAIDQLINPGVKKSTRTTKSAKKGKNPRRKFKSPDGKVEKKRGGSDGRFKNTSKPNTNQGRGKSKSRMGKRIS